jgi:hypothetical protein
VRRDHGPGAVADRRGQRLGVDAEGAQLAVDQPKLVTELADQVGHHRVAEGRADHLGARLEVERLEEEDQAGAARRDGDGLLRPDRLGKASLEALEGLSLPELAAAPGAQRRAPRQAEGGYAVARWPRPPRTPVPRGLELDTARASAQRRSA